MNELLQLIAQFGKLSKVDTALLTGYICRLHVKKGEHLLKEGNVCRTLAFILDGVVRVYVQSADDKEDTCYFLKNHQFVVALESFNQQVPANESLQAITDCELLTLSYDKMQLLYRQIPSWQSIVAKMTEHALLTKINHRTALVNADAKTRYENFLRDHRDIALRVPLGYIASYLGMTQQSLSRLRRELINSV